jgi:ubiquinone/menaquinone biosynthesis C-methylase UbiE
VRRGVKVIAVDESEKMLGKLVRRRLPGSVDCRVGSAERIPIDDQVVDYVFANMLLHHAEEPSRAIREMARVLRPGGVVVITDLDRHDFEFLRTEQHDRWKGFERESLSRWLQGAGLTNVAVESLGEDCCAKSSKGDEEATVSILFASGRTGNDRFTK